MPEIHVSEIPYRWQTSWYDTKPQGQTLRATTHWGVPDPGPWLDAAQCDQSWGQTRPYSRLRLLSSSLRSLHQQQSCADAQPQVSEQQTLVQLTQETQWPVYCSTWKANDPLHPSTHIEQHTGTRTVGFSSQQAANRRSKLIIG